MDATTIPPNEGAPELRAKLARCADELNADEVSVVLWVALRMLKGRETYAPLSIRNDDRDMLTEIAEEQVDTLAYAAVQYLKGHTARMRGTQDARPCRRCEPR